MLEKLVHMAPIMQGEDSFANATPFINYSNALPNSGKYGLDTPERRLEVQLIIESQESARRTFNLGASNNEKRVEKTVNHIPETIQIRQITEQTESPVFQANSMVVRLMEDVQGHAPPSMNSANVNMKCSRVKAGDVTEKAYRITTNNGETMNIAIMEFSKGFTGIMEFCELFKPVHLILEVDETWRKQLRISIEKNYPLPPQVYPLIKALEVSRHPLRCSEVRDVASAMSKNGIKGLMRRSRSFNAVWETLVALHRGGWIQRKKDVNVVFSLEYAGNPDQLCIEIEQEYLRRRKNCARLARLLQKGDKAQVSDYVRLANELRLVRKTNTQINSKENNNEKAN